MYTYIHINIYIYRERERERESERAPMIRLSLTVDSFEGLR